MTRRLLVLALVVVLLVLAVRALAGGDTPVHPGVVQPPSEVVSYVPAVPIVPAPEPEGELIEPEVVVAEPVTSQIMNHEPSPEPAAIEEPEPEPQPEPVALTPVEVALAQVGLTGAYADGGFWCAQFATWVYEQAGLTPLPSTSPLVLWNKLPRSSTPIVGGLVFVDLFNGTQPGAPVSHVGIVVAVEGDEITTVEGNAAPDPNVVTLHTRRLTDRAVVGFAAQPQEAT